MATNPKDYTIKQEGFLQSLRIGETQREAYKLNYNAKNMTDKCIDETACKLLATSKMSARYQELMTEVREKANTKGLLGATEVLRKLTDIIVRNESEDDRVALDGVKTYMKHLGLLTEKVEQVNMNVGLTAEEARKIVESAGIDPESV